jgi:hypothetical protein
MLHFFISLVWTCVMAVFSALPNLQTYGGRVAVSDCANTPPRFQTCAELMRVLTTLEYPHVFSRAQFPLSRLFRLAEGVSQSLTTLAHFHIFRRAQHSSILDRLG